MKPPIVSIIIPVYNQEKFVFKCVQSVIQQSYQNLQIIIVDDGSTDQSPDILQQLASQDDRIALIRQDNQGVAIARNRALNTAFGEYITFVDGDDYIDSHYIESLVSEAMETGADIVLTGITYIKESGSIQGTICPTAYEAFLHEEWPMRISAVCSHLYKRELWEKYHVRFSSGARGEDMPITLFFSGITTNFAIVQECGYYYVQHEASAMHQFRGLKKLNLPYEAIENSICEVQQIGIAGSRDYFCLFVFRILATCLSLARGADREKRKEVIQYVVRIVNEYFEDYKSNPLLSLRAKTEFPLTQKIAISLMTHLLRWNKLSVLEILLI